MTIQLIIPMAGLAQRFNTDPGESIVKPLIEVSGRKLYQWALESFSGLETKISLVFIIQKKHHKLSAELKYSYPDSLIIELERTTNGPGHTLQEALPFLNLEMPTVVCDCDLFFASNEFLIFLRNIDPRIHTGLLSFTSNNSNYSYIKMKDTQIIEIKEKEVISKNAVCGCYYFQSGTILNKLINETIQELNNGKEIFLSDIIKTSLRSAHLSRVFKCDYHVSLGTPEEILLNQKLLPSGKI
jgi:choline kinase